MAQSPLLGGDRAPQRHSGTGTDVLGPSDTSDTGSDITGAVGAVDTDALGLDGGTNDDVRRAAGAGADVGDANLDSDSDSGGSGERAEAGRDTLRRDAPDIEPDQVLGVGSDDNAVADEPDQLAADTAAEDDDDDLIDSDIDDGLSAQPPQTRAMPPRQRNTNRPIASGAGRDANEAATSGGDRERGASRAKGAAGTPSTGGAKAGDRGVGGVGSSRQPTGAERDRREAARTDGGDPVSDRDKSIDA
jgi:hypothetical protein